VIGTAPEEWVTERARLRFGFEAEALSIEAGAEPSGYAEGDLGWFVDRPVYVFGDLRVAVRLTSFLRREDRAWRIVHMHVSVGCA
jgi:SnoaL-like protein